MTQYFFGIMSALFVISAVDAINPGVPNDLWFYINTYLPF